MNRTYPHIDDMGHGVTREWRNERTVIYALSEPTNDAIDAYVTAVMEVVAEWTSTEPLYSVHDVRALQVITPYLRSQVMRLVRDAKHLVRDHKAIVLRDDLFGTVLRLFVNHHIERLIHGATHIVHTPEEGLAWLGEKRAKSPQS